MERTDGKMRARLLLATAPIREIRSLRSGKTTANRAVKDNDGTPYALKPPSSIILSLCDAQIYKSKHALKR